MKICLFDEFSDLTAIYIFRQVINASCVSHERLVNNTKNGKKNVYYLYIENGPSYNHCLFYFNRKKISDIFIGKLKDQIIVSESIKMYENKFRFICIQTLFL